MRSVTFSVHTPDIPSTIMVIESGKECYSPTGNMRGKLHVLGKFIFSGDVFDNYSICIVLFCSV